MMGTTVLVLGLPESALAQKSQPLGLASRDNPRTNPTLISGRVRPSAKPYIIGSAVVAAAITGLLLQRAANNYRGEMMVPPFVIIVPAIVGSAVVGGSIGYLVFRITT